MSLIIPLGDSLVRMKPFEPQKIYIPKPNFYGTDTFTFRANDGTSYSNIGVIIVDVGSISDSVVTAGRAVLGDVNGDGFVNIFDLVQVALQFGQIGDNLIGDVNRDSFVNLLDLVQVTRNFGQILSAPVSSFDIIISYVGAAATKSIVIGLIIFFTGYFCFI